MSRVVVINHLTLDGVTQGTRAPRGGHSRSFAHGGWAEANVDAEVNAAMGARSTVSTTGVVIATYRPT